MERIRMLLTCIELTPAHRFRYVLRTEEEPLVVAQLEFKEPLEGAFIGRWYGVSPRDIGPPIAVDILRQIQGEVDAR